jgi:hypothetical protein
MANTKALPNGWRYRQALDLVDRGQRANPLSVQNPLKCGRNPHLSGARFVGRLSKPWPLSRVGASLDNFSIFMAARNQGEVCFQVIPCNRSNPRFLRSPSELAQESSILVFG